jgi:hypothetical protein
VVPGARVEIGLWEGGPLRYKDTVSYQLPVSPDDPRFQVLARTVSDSQGRFRFDSMPRKLAYAMRAIPASGATWGAGYGGSLFGVPNGADLKDFPVLCVRVR